MITLLLISSLPILARTELITEIGVGTAKKPVLARICIEQERSAIRGFNNSKVQLGTDEVLLEASGVDVPEDPVKVDGRTVDITIGRDFLSQKLVYADFRKRVVEFFDEKDREQVRSRFSDGIPIKLKRDLVGNPYVTVTTEDGVQLDAVVSTSDTISDLGTDELPKRSPEGSFTFRQLTKPWLNLEVNGRVPLIGFVGLPHKALREWKKSITIADFAADRMLIDLRNNLILIPNRSPFDQIATMFLRWTGLSVLYNQKDRSFYIKDKSNHNQILVSVNGIKAVEVIDKVLDPSGKGLVWLAQLRTRKLTLECVSMDGERSMVEIPALRMDE